MRILVTFAIASELAASRPYFRDMDDVHVVLTGIGMRRPLDELRAALAANVDFCIAAGLAGSLKTEHPVGSIVVARGVKTETNRMIVTSDGGLVDAAAQCGAKPVDFFYTSRALVNSPTERSRLALSADAVDMESFYVLTEAHRAGVPAVAVRTISDSPERCLPMDFSRIVTDAGELAWLSMLAEVVKHPLHLGQFMRFGLESSRATRTLARFLDCYIEFLTTNDTMHADAEQIS